MKNRVWLPILILIFLLGRFLFVARIAALAGISAKGMPEAVVMLYQAAWYLVPLLVVMLLFHKSGTILEELGLSRPFLKGFLPAVVITLPMTLTYACIGTWPDREAIFTVLSVSLFAGFFEELYFRGFVFGQLYRTAGWGFIPAVLVNGLFFGLGHLYQSGEPFGAAMVFLVTLSASAWFSWLFIECGGNLWFPVSLHFLMNLSWGLFSMDATAAGGLAANIPRLATIAASILYILIFVRKGEPLKVRASNLWTSRRRDNGKDHTS